MEEKKEKRSVEEIDAEIAQVKAELAECKGADCEVYARIVGYYRSVKNWNKGKREEYGERKLFVESPQETAERLDAAQRKESEPAMACKHPELAWKCPNNRAGACARTAEQCFIEASMAARRETRSCGNETAAGAHIEKEASA